jgi:hypothetical protein
MKNKILPLPDVQNYFYRALHIFGQANFPAGGSDLGLSKFSILPQLLIKMMFILKVIKID